MLWHAIPYNSPRGAQQTHFFLDVAIIGRSLHPVLVLRVFCFNAPLANLYHFLIYALQFSV